MFIDDVHMIELRALVILVKMDGWNGWWMVLFLIKRKSMFVTGTSRSTITVFFYFNAHLTSDSKALPLHHERQIL